MTLLQKSVSLGTYHWVILTGEYPPQSGGVSDYSQLVAQALRDVGDSIQVWAPPVPAIADDGKNGIEVRRLPDCFGPRGLLMLHRALKRLPPNARLLVQYVPHSFGWKAMNLPLCVWLWTQRRKHCIFIMFHEVATPWASHGRWWRHNLLALVTRLMAFCAARSAKRIFVSIPAWKNMLYPLAGDCPIEWLSVPSNVAQSVDKDRARLLRQRLLREATAKSLIGHFGTFGEHVVGSLRLVVTRILIECRQTALLLIGRGSAEFAAVLRQKYPDIAGRVIGVGALESNAVAEHLAVCDLLIQPYSDGVSSRRGSVMAGLALGLPVLTTQGFLTESLWKQSGAVYLVDSAEEMVKAAIALLANTAERSRLGAAASALYRERFHIARTVAALREVIPSYVAL